MKRDLPKEEAFYVDVRVTRYLTRSHSKKKNPLRVLRFPTGNGTYENIVTNLHENEFCAEEIKEI